MASVNQAPEAPDRSQKDVPVGATSPHENITCDQTLTEQASAKENIPEKSISNVMEQGQEMSSSTVNKSAESNKEKPGPQPAETKEGVDKAVLHPTEQDQGHGGKLVSWMTDVKGKAVVKMTATSAQDNLEQTKTITEGSDTADQPTATSSDIKMLTAGDLCFPMTKIKPAKVPAPIEGSVMGKESFYAYSEYLTSKPHSDGPQYSVAKMQQDTKDGQEVLSFLNKLLDLINVGKRGTESTHLEVHEHLNRILLDWREHQPKKQEEELLLEKPEAESQSLAMTLKLSNQLQTICQNLASSVRGLPLHIEEQVQHFCKWTAEISSTLSSATSFQDLSAQFLAQMREKLMKIGDGMERVMDYVLNDADVDWLMGPISPHLNEGREPRNPTNK
ncbi:perilipin-3-like isoform X2 [Hypanus sabinus]|uniref:perilipin-3-like isoform X2 n=1 Tax=Hypanus sabinus TaxID=79690 RepID=UPI0028C3CA9F|nr:perilipin-3-like isoform X2 [Hypanus sabinus]